MARSSKTARQAGASALIMLGTGLLVWGYQESQSIGDQLSSAITGDPSNDVLLFYVGGAAALAAGLFLQFRR